MCSWIPGCQSLRLGSIWKPVRSVESNTFVTWYVLAQNNSSRLTFQSGVRSFDTTQYYLAEANRTDAFQAWIGGECIYVCLQAIWPSLETRIPNHMPPSTGMTTANFVSYIVFTVISLPMIYIKPHKLQIFFYVSAAIILIFEIVVLIWSLATMGERGFGDTMSDKNDGYSGWNIAVGIVSTIGGIAAGILNQNDYARFAKRPRDAILGQLISCPMYAIACSVIGILVTAATQERYGEALWNLPDLLGAVIRQGGSRSRTAAFFGGAALAISQIGVNVPGNALSGGKSRFTFWQVGADNE